MANRDIIVIGASAGGVETLKSLIGLLPPDLRASIFIVIHFPTTSTSMLPEILNRAGPLHAKHARDGERIRPGCIYVSVPNYHLMITDSHMRLIRSAMENGHRPAVDPLFRTAARALGPRVLGVILSGSLDDGSAGVLSVKACGGWVIAQDPAEALYTDMPRSAIETGKVDEVLPVAEMAKRLVELSRTPLEDSEMNVQNDDIEAREAQIVQADLAAQGDGQRHGLPSVMTCPECGGVVWEFDNGELIQFRCHVGHVYSTESMLDEQGSALEAALWVAVRTLVENATLSRRLGKRARKRGYARAAERFEAQAQEANDHADVVRRVLSENHLLTSKAPLPTDA